MPDKANVSEKKEELTIKRAPLYFSHINLLRGFAALSVVVYHVIELFPWKDFPIKPSVFLWFRVGWMGVDLFFVISGFVIMLSALKLQQTETVISAKKIFIRRRAARIIPLYLLTGTIFIIFIKPEILLYPFSLLIKHVFTHLSFTHNLLPDTHGSIDGPNWTVANEFQFYLFVFILMPFLKRLHPVALLIGGIAIAFISRAIAFMIAGYYQWDVFLRFQYATQMISMMDEFCFGMLIAKLVIQENNRILCPLENFLKSKYFWTVTGVTIIMFHITFKIYWSTPDYWYNPFMVICWRSLLGASFAMLIVITILVPSDLFLNNPVYRVGYYLGEISYGIYLWHLPVLLALKKAGFQSPLKFMVTTIFFVLVLSSLSWHFFEKPIIKRFK